MEEKKKKGSWEPQNLQTAIDKVMPKELSIRQAAMRYNIPKSTKHDKTKALNRGEEVTMIPKLGKFTKTFSAEYEQVLVDQSAPDPIQMIHNLSPLPDAAKKRTAARKRKCERSEILTSSPYKKMAEENEKNIKEEKKEIASKFKLAVGGKGKQTKGIKTKGKSIDKGKQDKNVKSKGSKVEPLTDTCNTNTTIWVICLEDTDEDWIQCSSCLGWAHEMCRRSRDWKWLHI